MSPSPSLARIVRRSGPLPSWSLPSSGASGCSLDALHRRAERRAKLGRERVFYDDWYEHEILGDDMDVLLQRFYHERSLMVVADLSDEYAGRPWCRAEARAIRALRFELDPARDEIGRLRLLNVKLGGGNVPGVFTTTAYLDGVTKTAEECAELILKRHALLVQRMSAPALAASEPQASAPHAARRGDVGKAPAKTTPSLEWLRRTGVHVAGITAYLVAVAALVKQWGKIFPSGGGGTVPGPAVWFAAAAVALPLLFLLAFNIIPAILHAREKRLRPVPDDRIDRDYFTTKPREDDPHGFFAHGYGAFLEWAAAPAAPILHPTGLSGSKAAVPIWVDFMKGAQAGANGLKLGAPAANIVFVKIDKGTGLLATPNCPATIDEAFIAGTEPQELCSWHGGAAAPDPYAPAYPAPSPSPWN